MHILGIVGGIGPESTIDYYRSIFEQHRAMRKDARAPSVIINSIDVGRVVQMVTEDDLGGLARYLLRAISRLANAGAGFALLAANTPHIVFDRVQEKAPIPLISIVEATAGEVKRREVKRPVIFGTRFTMSGSFYPEVFKREGLELISPNVDEQERLHSIYMNELLKGVVKNSSRKDLLGILSAVAKREKVDAVILGGTELSLILKEPEYDGVVALDTTQIHVRAAVERMLR